MRRTTILLAVLTCLLTGCRPASTASYVSLGDGGWECVRPKPSRQQWVDAHFIDDKTGWIVSANFNIMKTTDGGKNWAPQGHLIDKIAYDICFTDKDHGWVVGSATMSANDQSGIILKTNNGGATWRKVLDSKTDGLRSVSFVNNNIGWAVGGQPSKEGSILKTTDGGETWLKQDCGVLEAGKSRTFEDVWFVDENNGWVVCSSREVYKTTDGGKTWTPVAAPGKGWLRAVQFLDANTGWILNQNSVAVTTDGGKTWTDFRLGEKTYSSDFHFSNAKVGVVSAWGETWRTQDGGKTWIVNTEPRVGTFSPSAYMTDAKNGWLVGDYAFYHTSDGGATWQVQSGGDGDVALDVEFVNPKLGWALGYSARGRDNSCLMLKTTDGGETWDRQVLTVEGKINEAFFLNEKQGWAVINDGMLATKDGGITWKPQDTGTKSYLTAGLQFLDENVGYAAGMDGTVIKTTDGGETWNSLSVGTMDGLWGMSFIDKSTGWIAGENGRIMETTDGGQTWKRQVSGLTTCLGGLHFANEKVGWAADNKGNVIHTTDGGQTWTRQKSGVDQQLAMIRFVDDKEGWAASKPIIHTSDAGKTWTVQDHGTGLLWDICFADKDHGWAASAAGILRTTTGGLPGAVWAKKQADGIPANFGHLVVTKKSEGFLLAEHPDSRIGIHIKTSDAKPNVGDFIYVHGKVASENGEKIIAADSIDIMCAGWGILPEK